MRAPSVSDITLGVIGGCGDPRGGVHGLSMRRLLFVKGKRMPSWGYVIEGAWGSSQS